MRSEAKKGGDEGRRASRVPGLQQSLRGGETIVATRGPKIGPQISYEMGLRLTQSNRSRSKILISCNLKKDSQAKDALGPIVTPLSWVVGERVSRGGVLTGFKTPSELVG